jgi:Zn-dependent M28 family amino/carboxypeptidase
MKLFFISLFVFVQTVFCQSNSDKNRYAYKIISVLANDSLQGRIASSIFEQKAAQFIYNSFLKLHLKPQFQEFDYKKNDTAIAKKSKNIYCFVNHNADSTIILGAHYDHLGLGEGMSRSYGKKGIHPGADDNASGVAMLLDLAKNSNKWQSKKYNYLFVCYSAHEIGLFGSTAFATFIPNKFKKIKQVYNFDMVGRLDDNSKLVTIYGLKTLSEKQQNSFRKIRFFGKTIADLDDVILKTDASAFVKNNIPALSFTTGTHSDYHKISDTVDKINFQGLEIVENYVISVLKSLAY